VVCQGCGLSPYLFNTFINDIIGKLDTEEIYSPVISELRISPLLFADDFAIASFTCYWLHKNVELVDQCCENWNMKYNLSNLK
jgi:hypothetical protein